MTNKPDIVVLDGSPLNPGDISWDPIAALGRLTIHAHTEAAQLAERCANAEIILTNKVPITKTAIPSIKKCKLIGVLATGVNVVEVKAMKDAGITVCNVPNYGPDDVAQHALAMILELTRHAAFHSDSVKKGDWAKNGWCYWLKPPVSLVGLTLGIIGFGAIGQTLGRYGSCLGMEVMAWSRTHKEVDYPVVFADRNEIFAKADILSLNCPLTPETDNLINKNSLKVIKNGAIIINTARGGLVDETAVADALSAGALGGFGADVLTCEPPLNNNPLFTAPNTLITPHIAWATDRARTNIINIMAANIQAFLAGENKNRV